MRREDKNFYNIFYIGRDNSTVLDLDTTLHLVSLTTDTISIPQQVSSEIKHNFSAPSKESIHLSLLALGLEGNQNAIQFLTACNSPAAQNLYSHLNPSEIIISILTKKISSYERWNKQYPGFGGFLPWYQVNDTGAVLFPTGQWVNHVPGLDNGEMIWAAIAVAQVLTEQGYGRLAQRYNDLIQVWSENAVTVFYAGEGKVRAVTKILDIYNSNPTKANYIDPSGAPSYLDDPYEGEMLTFFMELYSTDESWINNNYSSPNTERENLWVFKRSQNMLQSTSLTNFPPPFPTNFSITVQKGYWFSAHEQWKYFLLPYTDIPLQASLYHNNEVARTYFSRYILFSPGLYASVTPPPPFPGYLSASGIQPIAFENVLTYEVVTPYGMWAIGMKNASVGLVWWWNMVMGGRMQGVYGSTCSGEIEGKEVGPVVTWDSKITTVLGLVGGGVKVVRRRMKDDGKYERFVGRVEKEWGRVFKEPLSGAGLDFALPAKPIPFYGGYPSCV